MPCWIPGGQPLAIDRTRIDVTTTIAYYSQSIAQLAKRIKTQGIQMLIPQEAAQRSDSEAVKDRMDMDGPTWDLGEDSQNECLRND